MTSEPLENGQIEAPKKKRGRPKGSKNKPKTDKDKDKVKEAIVEALVPAPIQDDSDLYVRKKYLAQAQKWLASDDGLADLRRDVIETLMVNLQIERDAGQSADNAGSRLSRKQYEETAKLLMDVLEDYLQ